MYEPSIYCEVHQSILKPTHITLGVWKSQHSCQLWIGPRFGPTKTMPPTPTISSARNATQKSLADPAMPDLVCQKATFRMCGTWREGDVGWPDRGAPGRKNEQ